VDIAGTFTVQMQWPGLPLKDAAGGSDRFTVKTMLPCSSVIPALQGTTQERIDPGAIMRAAVRHP
jgi:hypothetical protein